MRAGASFVVAHYLLRYHFTKPRAICKAILPAAPNFHSGAVPLFYINSCISRYFMLSL